MAATALAKSMQIRLIIERRGAPAEERTFEGEIVSIGSDPGASLVLADPQVAPEQAIIFNEDGRLLLINRAEGTRLNGEPLAREARRTLSAGDALLVGPFNVRVAHDSQAPAAEARDDESGAAATSGEAGARPEAADAAPRQETAPARSFAAILDSLRTEEDSFYFQVESADERRRVPIKAAEMMVGWDESGRRVTCDSARVVAPRAVVRKDWSGVVVLPLSAGMVSVNGETVEAPRRLRNGDRLTLLPTPHVAAPEGHALVFHEPASLIALDSLLPPQPLPAPVAHARAEEAAAAEPAGALAPRPRAEVERHAGARTPGRTYFGYFTAAEVIIMACGTLVGALVIFFVLEWLSP